MSLLEYLRELRSAKPSPAVDALANVEKAKLRALEILAARMNALYWEELPGGDALLGGFGWRRLLAAHRYLLAVERALREGRLPPAEAEFMK